MLKGVRRGLRTLRETKTNGLFNIIESIIVIKSFVREEYEREKQAQLQRNLIDAQIRQRKTNYVFDALKTFVEQAGVVLIIILTAYLVLDGQMTIGTIMFHILLFNNVSAPIRQLHRIYDEINEAMTYAEGFFEVLDADGAIEESGATGTKNLRGRIYTQKCKFHLPERNASAVRRFDADSGGKNRRVCRMSGAGKSTLLIFCANFTSRRAAKLCSTA
jgi:ABC-type bacteriocin/lantibiotic exporter with double-glycine peptidase domain